MGSGPLHLLPTLLDDFRIKANLVSLTTVHARPPFAEDGTPHCKHCGAYGTPFS